MVLAGICSCLHTEHDIKTTWDCQTRMMAAASRDRKCRTS